jgi:hypothetical protein
VEPEYQTNVAAEGFEHYNERTPRAHSGLQDAAMHSHCFQQAHRHPLEKRHLQQRPSPYVHYKEQPPSDDIRSRKAHAHPTHLLPPATQADALLNRGI